jgi:hypothetical protein
VTFASGPPPNRRLGHPLILIMVASGALIAGVTGAAIATSSPAPSAAATSSQPARPTPIPSGSPGSTGPVPSSGPAGAWPGRLGGFLPEGALHGQLVVPATGGGFQTEDIQTGQVTAVSRSSLTVYSADGYTKTYRVTSAARVLPGSGIGSVKTGDRVGVTAAVHGSAATVTTLIDLSRLGGSGLVPFGPGRTNGGSASG